MNIKYFASGMLFSLLLIVAASAQTDTDWQKANGGWIVIKNSHQYGAGGPFQSCSGQVGCMGYPLHVEHGVCINAISFADSEVGNSWTPPTNNVILAQDCGFPSGWNVANCPVVTTYWVPAGTYTLTEFTYVSEVNPGDPTYSPCHNAWSKPTNTVVIKPGDTLDFGESTFIGVGTCTVAGYPCSSEPLASSSATIKDFTWIGMDSDKVGTWDDGLPDGKSDGHFMAILNLPDETEIKSIKVLITDSTGAPMEGGVHGWSSSDENYWILGVFENGQQLNKRHVSSLGSFSGTVELDLYCTEATHLPDWGRFSAGNHFLLEIQLGDGTILQKYTVI